MNSLLEKSPFDADEGQLVGRDPRKVSAEEYAAHVSEFPVGMRLVRAKCLDCAHTAVEVRKCVCTTCPLWPYRMGVKPKAIRELRGEKGGATDGG